MKIITAFTLLKIFSVLMQMWSCRCSRSFYLMDHHGCDGTLIVSLTSKSRLDCSVRCTTNGNCVAFKCQQSDLYCQLLNRVTGLTSALASKCYVGQSSVQRVTNILAQQSTTYGPWVASNAIDGNYIGSIVYNTCTHTEEVGSNPWWRADIGSVRRIARVKIWNRTDCCGERLRDVTVTVGESSAVNTHQQCGYFGGSAGFTLTITCDSAVYGRYVAILQPLGPMTLCEVEVYAEFYE